MALASSLLVFACGDSGTTSTSGGSGGAGGQGSGGGSTSITAGAGGAGSSCDRICEKKTVNDTTLGCGYDGSTCVSDCESAFDQILMSCYDEAYAYNDCFIDQPPESFQCTPNDPNNGSTLATTACDAEYDAYVTCLGGG
jgi:hypothetical protein